MVLLFGNPGNAVDPSLTQIYLYRFHDLKMALFQSFLSCCPIRHKHREIPIKLFGMICLQKMGKLMCYHIFNTGNRRTNQRIIESEDSTFRLTTTPTGNHIAKTDDRECYTIFLKSRINGFTNIQNGVPAKRCKKFVNRFLFQFRVGNILYRQKNKRFVT